VVDTKTTPKNQSQSQRTPSSKNPPPSPGLPNKHGQHTSKHTESINQSDCKTKYSLLPGDLAVLPYFPKPNQKYGNTTKLFSESEVKTLAYRKAAVLGGVDVEEGDEVAFLERGRELFEEKK
jgi:hypothetical protein